jgi:hypothetical protein
MIDPMALAHSHHATVRGRNEPTPNLPPLAPKPSLVVAQASRIFDNITAADVHSAAGDRIGPS